MSLTSRTIKNFIGNIHFSTFIIALTAATAALWLNSKYVALETYEKDKQIWMLKVENLEMETKSIRFLISTNQSELTGLTTVLVKIERLISKLIDDDGDIIHSAELRKLEIDIAEIKKDISYIRDSNK
jgi:hypothetical protein